LLFIWNLFCGTKYPKLPGNTAPKFNNKYVTDMKLNPAKPTMGDSLAMDLEKMWTHFSER
jgi:hypothetical protein